MYNLGRKAGRAVAKTGVWMLDLLLEGIIRLLEKVPEDTPPDD